jgi:HKD family nuclease
MKITFLAQGYEAESTNAVGNHLANFLVQDKFNSFFGISAFASSAGVSFLSKFIDDAKRTFASLTLIVGVDEQGTAKEALYKIQALEISSFIFFQKEPPIFHPKIYLFEGDNDTALILGSSNFTARGLFSNVESSLLIEFNRLDNDGQNLIASIKDYYRGLFDLSDPNLFPINPEIIEDFVKKGIVPNERVWLKKQRKNPIGKRGEGEDRVDEGINIPSRDTAKIPIPFRKRPKEDIIATKVIEELQLSEEPVPQVRTLVWEKRNLSRSDAQRVPEGTNPTGNLKLSQAGFKISNVNIDQTVYFRQEVFSHLNWAKPKPNNDTYEEVLYNFEVKIFGINEGIHTIKLSHDPVRIAHQKNTPTWLHWGNDLSNILQKNDITDKTIDLYRLDDDSFSIEIV